MKEESRDLVQCLNESAHELGGEKYGFKSTIIIKTGKLHHYIEAIPRKPFMEGEVIRYKRKEAIELYTHYCMVKDKRKRNEGKGKVTGV